MRPIRRGTSPRATDFSDYTDAKPDLISRLGPYCSFCERPVTTQLAVEHVQPKGLPAYAHLIGRWDNFLLACVNCNSTKKNKNVVLAQVLLPDRDNTFAAFEYLRDGTVQSSGQSVAAGLSVMADASLSLTGLNKGALNTPNANGTQIALDRVRQRMEAWLIAEEAKTDLQRSPYAGNLRKWIVKTAVETGFFSVWMTVFAGDIHMRRRLVDAFPGTDASGCFDAAGNTVSPAPNPDALAGGSKI